MLSKILRKSMVTICLICFVFMPSNTYASKAKEILVTSTYGVLAGTIVGVATLAFASNPGGRLRNVAVGASLGLYAGILLGAYLAYGVKLKPKIIEENDEDYDDEEYDESEDDEGALLDPLIHPLYYSQDQFYAKADNFKVMPDIETKYDHRDKGISFIFPVVVYNF